MKPLVSVLMASYNAEAWIAESIESVLSQTYGNFELVVADDASGDRTREIVRGFRDERVRLLEFDERAGPTRRRNDALDASKGELLGWLDHDDLWLPEKLEREVALLAERSEVGLVYSGYEAFDSATGELVPWRDESLETEGDVLADLFVEGCFIGSLTVLFRREGLDRRELRFREAEFSFGDDYYLWLGLALDWQVARIDEVLARYRRHGGNESQRLSGINYHLMRIRLLRDFLSDFPEARDRLGPAVRTGLMRHYLAAARFEFEQDRPMRGRWLLLRALALRPRLAASAVRQG